MNRSLIIFAVRALVASSTQAEDLKKLNLDDASAIGTTLQTDTQVKAEGKSSIKITTRWPTTIREIFEGRKLSTACGCNYVIGYDDWRRRFAAGRLFGGY